MDDCVRAVELFAGKVAVAVGAWVSFVAEADPESLPLLLAVYVAVTVTDPSARVLASIVVANALLVTVTSLVTAGVVESVSSSTRCTVFPVGSTGVVPLMRTAVTLCWLIVLAGCAGAPFSVSNWTVGAPGVVVVFVVVPVQAFDTLWAESIDVTE